jgi:hypothetical protein
MTSTHSRRGSKPGGPNRLCDLPQKFGTSFLSADYPELARSTSDDILKLKPEEIIRRREAATEGKVPD